MVASNAFIITEMEKQAEERAIKQVAKKMLQMGMSNDEISKATGLSDKVIEELKK